MIRKLGLIGITSALALSFTLFGGMDAEAAKGGKKSVKEPTTEQTYASEPTEWYDTAHIQMDEKSYYQDLEELKLDGYQLTE